MYLDLLSVIHDNLIFTIKYVVLKNIWYIKRERRSKHSGLNKMGLKEEIFYPVVWGFIVNFFWRQADSEILIINSSHQTVHWDDLIPTYFWIISWKFFHWFTGLGKWGLSLDFKCFLNPLIFHWLSLHWQGGSFIVFRETIFFIECGLLNLLKAKPICHWEENRFV